MIQHGESSGLTVRHQCSQTAETDNHQEEVIKSGGELKKSVLSYATPKNLIFNHWKYFFFLSSS